MGSYSVVLCVRHLTGQPLYCSAADAGMWGERSCDVAPPPTLTQQYRLASLASWLSSTGISHHSLLPHIPLICLLQSTAALTLGLLHKRYAPAPSCCPFQGTCVPVWDMYICGRDCLSLIPFRLPQISCFPLSLKCSSSDSGNCPNVGIKLLLQFPHPPRAGPILLTLLFSTLVPSSYRVLHGSMLGAGILNIE